MRSHAGEWGFSSHHLLGALSSSSEESRLQSGVFFLLRRKSLSDVALPLSSKGSRPLPFSLHLAAFCHLQSFRICTASLGRKLNSVPYLPPRLLSPLRILPSPSRSTVISLAALVGALVGSLIGSLVGSLVGSLLGSLVGGKVVDSMSG